MQSIFNFAGAWICELIQKYHWEYNYLSMLSWSDFDTHIYPITCTVYSTNWPWSQTAKHQVGPCYQVALNKSGHPSWNPRTLRDLTPNENPAVETTKNRKIQHSVADTALSWWSNGDIFRVTGHLCGEFTGSRWILHTKASDAELWCFLWSAPE